MTFPVTLSFARARLLDSDRKAIPSLLKLMEQQPAAALEDLAPLVFDVIRIENQAAAAAALSRMLALRPQWANETLKTGDTALMEAVWFNKVDLIAILLAAGAQTRPRNTGKLNALDAAATMSASPRTQSTLANALLGNGKFTRAQKDRALRNAATCGNLGMTRSLLAHGAGFGSSRGQATALACASRCDEEDSQSLAVVRALLATDAGLAIIDQGWGPPASGAPVHCAARSGNLKILAFLLDTGAAVNPPEGLTVATPLMSAAFGLHPEAISALIQKGADASAVDRDGRNALHYLARSDDEIEQLNDEMVALDLLVRAGADPLLKDNQGRTPLDLARENGWDSLAGALAAMASSSDLVAGTAHPDETIAAAGPRL